MKPSRVAPLLPVISICLALGFGVGQGQQGSSLLGDWTGESICVGNNPSCHDEKVIYHVSAAADGPDKVAIAADKIVNGKPETMGVIDLKYDASKQMLTGETQTARYRLWREFTVKGDIMQKHSEYSSRQDDRPPHKSPEERIDSKGSSDGQSRDRNILSRAKPTGRQV